MRGKRVEINDQQIHAWKLKPAYHSFGQMVENEVFKCEKQAVCQWLCSTHELQTPILHVNEHSRSAVKMGSGELRGEVSCVKLYNSETRTRPFSFYNNYLEASYWLRVPYSEGCITPGTSHFIFCCAFTDYPYWTMQ